MLTSVPAPAPPVTGEGDVANSGAAASRPLVRWRVFAFGAGDPYTACFNAALRARGIDVFEAAWSGSWLMPRVRRGDVLHLHWPSFLYTIPGSRIATWLCLLRFTVLMSLLRARGARIVWTAHNLYPHDNGHAPVHRLGRRIVIWLASRVCVHGPAAAATVQREFRLPAARLVLIEHGHWIDFYPNAFPRELARQRLDIPRDAFVYLFVGLCKPYKNLEQLVRSHAALADPSRLWIVGRFQSADYRERVKQAVAADGSSQVTVLDAFVPDADLQLYLNACDVVALPYRETLTSGAAMLALSFGRPVIGPRLGSLPEVITDDCGVLYDPQAANGLVEAMREVQRRHFDPGRILDRARQFSWARSADSFVGTMAEGSLVPPENC
jgi:beta-1,4-mannosyltransferase